MSPGVLCAIQSSIGDADQFVDASGLPIRAGYGADTDGYVQGPGCCLEGPSGKRLADLFRAPRRFCRRTARKQNQELLAAVASCTLEFSGGAPGSPADLP